MPEQSPCLLLAPTGARPGGGRRSATQNHLSNPFPGPFGRAQGPPRHRALQRRAEFCSPGCRPRAAPRSAPAPSAVTLAGPVAGCGRFLYREAFLWFPAGAGRRGQPCLSQDLNRELRNVHRKCELKKRHGSKKNFFCTKLHFPRTFCRSCLGSGWEEETAPGVQRRANPQPEAKGGPAGPVLTHRGGG